MGRGMFFCYTCQFSNGIYKAFWQVLTHSHFAARSASNPLSWHMCTFLYIYEISLRYTRCFCDVPRPSSLHESTRILRAKRLFWALFVNNAGSTDLRCLETSNTATCMPWQRLCALKRLPSSKRQWKAWSFVAIPRTECSLTDWRRSRNHITRPFCKFSSIVVRMFSCSIIVCGFVGF